MEDGGTCRYINVESATAYWRGAGCPNRKRDLDAIVIETYGPRISCQC